MRAPVVAGDVLVIPGGQSDLIAIERRAVEDPASILGASDLPVLAVGAEVHLFVRIGILFREVEIDIRAGDGLAILVENFSRDLS